MPKTAETLRRPVFKEDVLHSHIAETYFHQKTRAKPRKKKRTLLTNIDLRKVIIIAVSTTAVLAIILGASIALHNHYITQLKKKVSALQNIKIVDRGMVNKEIIRNFEFRGYAKNITSRNAKDFLILNNPKKYNWAETSVNFKFPIDLSGRDLFLSLRGASGGEKINIVLRDIKNKSVRLDDLSLSSNMNEKLINIGNLKKDIDLTNINHIRIEYGHMGESASLIDSPIPVTIYVANIGLIKKEK